MQNSIFSPALITLIVGLLFVILAILYTSHQNAKARRRTIASVVEAVAIPAYRQMLPLLRKEVSRVRRYQRNLSIIVLKPSGDILRVKMMNTMSDNGELARNTNGAHEQLSQIEFLLCGPILRDALREIDITAYDGANNQFIILLPECSRSDAEQTVSRLNEIIGQRIGNQLSAGIAEFPENGLIVEDLLKYAMKTNSSSDDGQRIHADLKQDLNS